MPRMARRQPGPAGAPLHLGLTARAILLALFSPACWAAPPFVLAGVPCGTWAGGAHVQRRPGAGAYRRGTGAAPPAAAGLPLARQPPAPPPVTADAPGDGFAPGQPL
ncbi:MAG: hypothetical protein J3K34DRAFT_422686, partial [Monoraphidium minutum]